MLEQDHQDFLGKYFNVDEHYSKEEAPLGYLKHGKDVSPEHIHKILTTKSNNPLYTAEYFAAIHPNTTNENLEIALNHPEWSVRLGAISNPNISKSQLIRSTLDKINLFVIMLNRNILRNFRDKHWD